MPKTCKLHHKLLLFVCFGLLLAPEVALAQIQNVTDDTSTPIPGAGHDYLKMFSETVNPANGSLSVRIQVPIPKGRGLTLPFSFAYDSNGVHHISPGANPGTAYWNSNLTFMSGGDWSYSLPMINQSENVLTVSGQSCDYVSDYVFRDPGGGRHSLFLAAASPETACWQGGATPVTATTGGDDDFTASIPQLCGTFYYGCAEPPPVTVADQDGTAYYFSNSTSFLHSPIGGVPAYSALPDYIVDRNGNQITFTDLNLTNGQRLGAFQATDTMGRVVLSATGFGYNGDTVTVAGFGGGSYGLAWSTQGFSYSVPVNTVHVANSYCGGIQETVTSTNPATPAIPVIESISLPNNGGSYQFTYDGATGLLNQITYPSGAYVSYDWNMSPAPNYTETMSMGDTLGNPYGCYYEYSTPVITDRYVNDGTQNVLHQHFTYDIPWNSWPNYIWSAGARTTTVTTTDLVKTGSPSFTTTYAYSPYSAPFQPNDSAQIASIMPLEQQIQYGDWSGSTIRTVNKSWGDEYLVACQSTTSNLAGVTSRIDYAYATHSGYDATWGAQLIDKEEWNWGQQGPCPTPYSPPTGIPLLETQIAYPNPPLGDTLLYTAGPSIFDRRRGRPPSVRFRRLFPTPAPLTPRFRPRYTGWRGRKPCDAYGRSATPIFLSRPSRAMLLGSDFLMKS